VHRRRGRTLMPGLIDNHLHILMTDGKVHKNTLPR
jgi:imidazolonepropionase-like amidohydrolase